MSEPGASAQPLRLFLDAGVIIEGCFQPWGASKGVLVLATLRSNFTVVLAEAIEREVQRALARKTASLDAEAALTVARGMSGWIDRVRIERHALPTEEELRPHLSTVLPVLKHMNDLPAVVTAMRAHPDWVLSTKTEHWNARLGERIGLRIATPRAFLQQLHPQQDA